jgi:hypothetical protein
MLLFAGIPFTEAAEVVNLRGQYSEIRILELGSDR